jgi:hypothetical protein
MEISALTRGTSILTANASTGVDFFEKSNYEHWYGQFALSWKWLLPDFAQELPKPRGRHKKVVEEAENEEAEDVNISSAPVLPLNRFRNSGVHTAVLDAVAENVAIEAHLSTLPMNTQ